MDAICTHHLTKFYGKSRGINDVCLSVPQGDFFGFIGPNGSGKSTTIRTLLGLLSPSSGSAEVLGMDTQKQTREILAQVGYLPSEAIFYGGMRVRDLLRYSASLRKLNCDAEAQQLCERLELDPSKRVDELSLGNRKKVGIVCAMQHNPRLYVFDEPTSGLDPLMQREFYVLLQERNRAGATVFLSCHILSEVQRYCKSAAIIREGRLLISDRVECLSRTGAKRVTVRGVSALPPLPEIRDAKLQGDSLSFLFGGTPEALLQLLSSLPLTDLSITEPDLEEVFLHFYTKEEA